jgi:polyisoprenyl-phosphate glycosyltransferase
MVCEIVVVDNGSTDGTVNAAASAGSFVIHHPASGGYGKNLMDGIQAAQHDIIVITDGDGNYPTEWISDLVSKIGEGFEMGVGASQGTEQFDSPLRAPARLLFKFLAEFTTGARVPDINSGMRSFRKSEILPYFPDLCGGFSFTTALTLIYKLTGKFILYLPIEYRNRIGESKVSIIRDSLRTLQYVVKVIITYNPLKLYLLLCLFLSMLATVTFVCLIFSREPALPIVTSRSEYHEPIRLIMSPEVMHPGP